MDKVLSVLKNTKILGIVGCALLILGNFFSFASISIWGFSESVSLVSDEMDNFFWILVLGVLALALVYIDFIISKIPEGKVEFLKKLRNPKLVLIPAIISVIMIFVKASNVDIFKYSYIKAGFGFYLLLIGAIALAAYPFLHKSE